MSDSTTSSVKQSLTNLEIIQEAQRMYEQYYRCDTQDIVIGSDASSTQANMIDELGKDANDQNVKLAQ